MRSRAEALAGWARRHAGFDDRFIPPGKIAARVGITRVTIDPTLREDGRLVIGPAGAPEIVIGGSLDRHGALHPRQMFTLAHEIAHYLLWRWEGLALDQQVGDEEVEEYCDRFASALLLPPRWLSREYGCHAPGIGVVNRAAARTGVSRSAVVVALNYACGWDVGLVRFRWSRGRWRLISSLLPVLLQHQLLTTDSTTKALLALDEDEGSSGRRLLLPLKLGSSCIETPADVEVRRDVTALLLLHDFVELARTGDWRSPSAKQTGRPPQPSIGAANQMGMSTVVDATLSVGRRAHGSIVATETPEGLLRQ